MFNGTKNYLFVGANVRNNTAKKKERERERERKKKQKLQSFSFIPHTASLELIFEYLFANFAYRLPGN